MIIVVVAGGGYGVIRYLEISRELDRVKGTQTSPANAQEVKRIVGQVGKLMELSSAEEPTVATVTDVDKLRDQPFFQRAQNDDKVLIYTSERRAILYRPSTNKIIDVAPVNLSDSTASAQTQTQDNTALPGTFAIYNGTGATGLSRRYENELREKLPNATIVARETAVNQNTPRTFVVDIAGNKTNQLRSIAETLGIDTGLLPQGQATPAADFLIIIGRDKVQAEPTPG